MIRIKRGYIARRRRKKILKINHSFQSSSKNAFKAANQKYLKAKTSAYRDRKTRKRLFRNLWTHRINSATRSCGLSFNQFIHYCKKSNILLNRKIISQLIIHDSNSFFDEFNLKTCV